ncbi:putative enzyme related to lactoylglutathione lyase [Arthrobacter sp. UYP6]|uniref:VOC family protein n=1 Tax=Arthrobacter sp. UYP6 TaxID=1756378 RepID=UPI0033945192
MVHGLGSLQQASDVWFFILDLATAAAFYEDVVGLTRAPASPPHAVVFGIPPIAFAVRETIPDVDLDSVAQPGLGVVLWLHDPDAADLHQSMAEAGVAMTQEPFEGPFGTTFTFLDPDGYAVTVHNRR